MADPVPALRRAVEAFKSGRPGEALVAATEALAVAPSDANARKLVMAAAARAGVPALTAEAIAGLRRAGAFGEALFLAEGDARSRPDDAAAWNRLGNLLQVLGRMPDAESAYRRALATGDRSPRLLRNLGVCLARQDRADEAIRYTEVAATGGAVLSWSDARILPFTHPDVASIERWRSRYLEGLGRTRRLLSDAQPAALIREAQDGFLAHYPCRGDDVALQRPMGAIYAEAAARLWNMDALPPHTDGRVHVGFVSAFFREHTVGRLFSGWLEALDPERFAVRAWHLGRPDAFTAELARRVPGLEVLDAGDAGAVGRRIRDARLHAIVFPELGMDVPTLRVAAQRLAPVQAVSWGHPVTTALPSIDVFLSSEAMEPADGQRHYTEELVPLPGLGFAPRDPLDAPGLKGREDFALPPEVPLLLNTQSVIKLMPDADPVWVDIARRCPEAVLVFLAGDGVQGGPGFRRRLSAAFRSAGLAPEQRLRFPGPLDHGDFLDLNACCDVFLDGLGWSGGWTTIEAISTGLVPVTVAGDRMRSRHTAAIVRSLGAPGLVAADGAGFVGLVASMVEDASLRASTGAHLRARLPALLSRSRSDGGLAQWLEGVAGRMPA